MRKVLSTLLAALIAVSCVTLPMTAFADEYDDDYYFSEEWFTSEDYIAEQPMDWYAAENPVARRDATKAAIVEHMRNRDPEFTVDIIIYEHVNVSAEAEITTLMREILDEDSYLCCNVKNYTFSWEWSGIDTTTLGYEETYNDVNYQLFNLTINVNYRASAQQEKEIDAKCDEIIQSLDLTNKSDYQKIKAIHDYIVNNTSYDSEHVSDLSYNNQFTAYGALIDGKAICQGYSAAFYRLCEKVGINCEIFIGFADANGVANKTIVNNHTWNFVKLDDLWYSVDCTWDDPSNLETLRYDYFLKGSTSFGTTHTATNRTLTDYAFSKEDYVMPEEPAQEPSETPENPETQPDVQPEPTPEPHKHTYKQTLTPATMTSAGYLTSVCTDCGNTIKTNPVAKIASVTLSQTSYTYDGKIKTPTVTVKDANGKTLVKDKDYTASYATGRTSAGKYNVTVVFKGNYAGNKVLTFTINKQTAANCTAKLSQTSYTYDGKTKTPTVSITDKSGRKLKSSTDYTVTYPKTHKAVGKYTVKITYKGNYSGTKSLSFTIKPKATTLSSVKAKSKGFTVKWKKLTTQTTGYQIQYSTSSKFTSKTSKTVTVSKNTTTSKTISKLKAKKKYYVRIRTYKTVKINGKSTKIYSSWSKAKSVTTKK